MKEKDRIILGNFNSYSLDVIQNKAVKLNCKILGGWNFENQKNDTIKLEDFLLLDSTADITEKLVNEKPNTAVVFMKSEILDGIGESIKPEIAEKVIEEITNLKMVETIEKIIFISFNIDVLTVRRLYKELFGTKITPYFITGFHAAYLGADPDVIAWNQLEIDPDLDKELRDEHICNGKFLDVGTGSGRQAICLYKRGFDVTGIDIVPYAFSNAKINEPGIRFLEDDILHTKLTDIYDYIFDRGCFHSIKPSERILYFEQIYKLLKKGGLLFMKCRSTDISRESTGYHNEMPYCLSEDMYIPEEYFRIKKVRTADYLSSTNASLFNALFFVIEKYR